MLVAAVAAVAVFGGTAGAARADYGTGTQYQVEISANNVYGGNFWFWAALGPGQESDYQNTDCIHTSSFLGPNGTEGAAHSSGSLAGWSDANGVIAMIGVKIIGGLETANFYVSDAAHSNSFTLVATGGLPILPQGVPLTWSGPQTQVQVAP